MTGNMVGVANGSGIDTRERKKYILKASDRPAQYFPPCPSLHLAYDYLVDDSTAPLRA